jgi:hypothetical protein
MLYALLDGSGVIEQDHLRAALAFWSYADTSAKLIFGEAPEDPLMGMVLSKLQETPSGMTRTDLHNSFSRNIPAATLLDALAKLRDRGDAYAEKQKTGRPGAPAERWFARRTNEKNELIDPASPDQADEENELIDPASPDQASDGIDSLNSSVRRLSPAGADGEEIVTI